MLERSVTGQPRRPCTARESQLVTGSLYRLSLFTVLRFFSEPSRHCVILKTFLVRHVSSNPWAICWSAFAFDCVTVPRRHISVGHHGARITGLAHKSSFEAITSSAGALRRCSRPMMWQVWQEQPGPPQEVPNLQLPRKRLLL